MQYVCKKILSVSNRLRQTKMSKLVKEDYSENTTAGTNSHDDLNITTDIAQASPTAESEFDEFLDIPDFVSVCSITGEPVFDQGKSEVEEALPHIIPFTAIHNPPIKFKSSQRLVFIPGVEIKVHITDVERSATTHLLNPNLYTIQLKHENFSWVIKKRYKHIQHLHQQLRLYKASLNIPFPTKSHKERRSSFKNNVEIKKGKKKGALPRFPSKPDALVPYEQLDQRRKQLQDYLSNLLNISIYRNHHETVQFLQVSHLSFIQGLGDKGKEGEIMKRTGSTQPGQTRCNFCGLIDSPVCFRCNYFWCDILCGSWKKRWFFVKETCFGYIYPKEGLVKCVVLFDQGFEVSSGMVATGLSNGLQIQTNSRQIMIKCWTRRKSKEWMSYLRDTAHHKASDFTQPNEHSSFVPFRTSIKASWFVDGSDYMSAVADALECAKEEIFIADWWLSPEIYMKRPVIHGDYWRLDKILQRKANDGVKVFVLLYKEVEFALGINSFYSKQRLTDHQSDNIKVLRHPDHARVGVFLWAHHEKIVVVDQSYAFLGGIDLCYGRWDDYKHRLTDLGSVSHFGSKKKQTSSTPTGDSTSYSFLSLALASNTIATAGVPPILETDSLNKNESLNQGNTTLPPNLPVLQPGDILLMPKSNVNIKCNTPEMERKNPIGKFTVNVKTKTKDFLSKLSSPNEMDNENNIENTTGDSNEIQGFQNNIKNDDIVDNLSGSSKLWIGKDYVNFIVKDFANLDLPFIDFVDRQSTPRMPWHDVGVLVRGSAARDVARHFIERWNATKLEKARLNCMYPYLMPKSYNIHDVTFDIGNINSFNVTCQVLRSVCNWSAGYIDSETIEQSIHEAYIDTINRSQHYIYIENQFFITLAMDSLAVKNQIGEALFKRICRAHRENSIFRVYVVMPLLPGFEGEVGGATGVALHTITHWNYASIGRGKDSIITRLIDAGISDPSKYISFYGLRTHSILNGEPVTELIYVHSKLLIVDDCMVICGSANINDRSMLGKRDSEIAVLIKDEEFVPGKMNGISISSGKFAGSLRKYLFREHLGMLENDKNSKNTIDVDDPVKDEFYTNVWMKIADSNTSIYEKVFHCIPSDNIFDFSSLKIYQEEVPLYLTDSISAKKLLYKIKGHLVRLPLNFLSNEILTPPGGSVEGMMPTSLWT